MTPLKIGACLKTPEIKNHRDWLFDAARDIELQDFMTHAAMTSEFDARTAQPRPHWMVIRGVVAGTPAGLLDTQLANDLDIHDAVQIQRFPPPQV